ncbi:MAG: hypothetical protein J0G99_01535 [Alphaproteobacteria bacterium]|nr:hypothetical protein [Alphaproteobacteria bacterium]
MGDRFSKGDAGNALRTLVAFSAARSFSLKNNNPLDVILPLFEPIATSLHGQQFNAETCAAELADRYDLLVSEELCVYWSGQLIKSGLLKPAASAMDSGAYANQKRPYLTSAPRTTGSSRNGETDGETDQFC